MKTPEEIKELLANHKGYIYDGEALMADALAYIQHLEARKWDLFDLLSSAWFGKRCYFQQEDGTVYSRSSGEYMSFDQAIDEFAHELTFERESPGEDIKVSSWISVEERLPDKQCEFLVLYSFGETDVQRFCGMMYFVLYDERPHFENDGLYGLHVTHWMPLPEPPKEG